MDLFTWMLLWFGLGMFVTGVVGNLKGNTGAGLICGLFLGPIFGTIATLYVLRNEPRALPEPRP